MHHAELRVKSLVAMEFQSKHLGCHKWSHKNHGDNMETTETTWNFFLTTSSVRVCVWSFLPTATSLFNPAENQHGCPLGCQLQLWPWPSIVSAFFELVGHPLVESDMIPEAYVAWVTTVRKERTKRRERMGFPHAEDQMIQIKYCFNQAFQIQMPATIHCTGNHQSVLSDGMLTSRFDKSINLKQTCTDSIIWEHLHPYLHLHSHLYSDSAPGIGIPRNPF